MNRSAVVHLDFVVLFVLVEIDLFLNGVAAGAISRIGRIVMPVRDLYAQKVRELRV